MLFVSPTGYWSPGYEFNPVDPTLPTVFRIRQIDVNQVTLEFIGKLKELSDHNLTSDKNENCAEDVARMCRVDLTTSETNSIAACLPSIWRKKWHDMSDDGEEDDDHSYCFDQYQKIEQINFHYNGETENVVRENVHNNDNDKLKQKIQKRLIDGTARLKSAMSSVLGASDISNYKLERQRIINYRNHHLTEISCVNDVVSYPRYVYHKTNTAMFIGLMRDDLIGPNKPEFLCMCSDRSKLVSDDDNDMNFVLVVDLWFFCWIITNASILLMVCFPRQTICTQLTSSMCTAMTTMSCCMQIYISWNHYLTSAPHWDHIASF